MDPSESSDSSEVQVGIFVRMFLTFSTPETVNVIPLNPQSSIFSVGDIFEGGFYHRTPNFS